MTIPLNAEVLQHAYDYLRSTEPFCKWNLPDSEDVVFGVIRSRTIGGRFYRPDNKPVIEISSSLIGYTVTLMSLMAHEMIHLHQNEVWMETRGAEHNAAFKKLAARVCKYHGFDPKLF